MYDSITPGDIPLTAQMVAGYVDGSFRWPDSGWARFPNAVQVRIAVSASTNDGHVLDVEAGAASPFQVPGWLKMRAAAGVQGSVYVNQSNWDQVRSAVAGAGLAQPPYWLAKYDNVAEVPAGTVAKQYANPAITGQHYDLSAVSDFWPGVDSGGKGAEAVTGPEKLAFVRLSYSAFLWRVPSADEENGWAAQIADDSSNLDGILANIEDSSEGNAVKAARAKLLQYVAANNFPGTPVGAHTHGFSGQTATS